MFLLTKYNVKSRRCFQRRFFCFIPVFIGVNKRFILVYWQFNNTKNKGNSYSEYIIVNT